jgi:hypothetical protein
MVGSRYRAAGTSLGDRDSTRRGIAVIRSEHDSATTWFDLEDTGDNMRQQQSTETLIDESQLGDGRV